MEKILKEFLTVNFDSFTHNINSYTLRGVQDSISDALLRYYGTFIDGDFYLSDKDDKLCKKSSIELSEMIPPFSEEWISGILTYTHNIGFSTNYVYNGIYIKNNTQWMKGGLYERVQEFVSFKSREVSFDFYLDCSPSLDVRFVFKATLKYNNNNEAIIVVSLDHVMHNIDEPSNKVCLKEDTPNNLGTSLNQDKFTGYYASIDGSMEVQTVIDKFGLNWNRGCVLKYIVRAGKKDPSKEVEDLEKAKKYIDYEIRRVSQQ